MSSANIKKIENLKCIETFDGIENFEILEGLKNLDYLRGIDNAIIGTMLKNEEIEENQIVEDVEELVETVNKIIESADKIVEVVENVENAKCDEKVTVDENADSFTNNIKKLGVTELFINAKSKFNETVDIDYNNENIDIELINNLKPKTFRSKLNELNNREVPGTIQKLFNYTKKSHKFNGFCNFFRTIKMAYFKFKYKNIEFIEWQNTAESEKLLLEFIKNINTNWSLKYHEFEKTVYNSKTLIHKRRMLYVDPFGYIEPGTTLYKVKIPYTSDEDKYLLKLID